MQHDIPLLFSVLVKPAISACVPAVGQKQQLTDLTTNRVFLQLKSVYMNIQDQGNLVMEYPFSDCSQSLRVARLTMKL